MNTKTTDEWLVRGFELSESNPENGIFRRVIRRKGRKPKELKKIVDDLPTVTIHYFSREDFDNLKTIEAKLIDEYETYSIKKKITISLARYLYNILDIE